MELGWSTILAGHGARENQPESEVRRMLTLQRSPHMAEIDAGDEFDMAQSRWQHKSELAGLGFLVVDHRTDKFFFVNVRQRDWQPQRDQQGTLAAYEFVVHAPKSFRQSRSAHHADRNRFTVQ